MAYEYHQLLVIYCKPLRMRKKIVAGNWKMYKTYQHGLELVSELAPMVLDEVHGNVQVVLGTPYIHLQAIARLVEAVPRIKVAAQNCHYAKDGAFTGEISAAQVASTGAAYVILGHSERRQYFDEGATLLYDKTVAALEAGLTPIFCIGETKDLREAGTHNSYVRSQLADVLFKLSPQDMAKVVIAYEPIWAIGTGLTASPEQAQDMHKEIRTALAEHFGPALADNISILYGGSVKAANAKELFSQPDIDGGLVGGASLQSREFAEIIKAMA